MMTVKPPRSATLVQIVAGIAAVDPERRASSSGRPHDFQPAPWLRERDTSFRLGLPVHRGRDDVLLTVHAARVETENPS
jgi:hypothetical protein